MMTRKIDVSKETTDLKALLALVAEGSEVILTEGDTLLARLMPVGGRIAGLHRGGFGLARILINHYLRSFGQEAHEITIGYPCIHLVG